MVNCLLLVTGSVATIKTFKLYQELLKTLPENSQVQCVATESAIHFLQPGRVEIPDSIEKEQEQEQEETSTTSTKSFFDINSIKIWRDQDEWQQWQKRGDTVLHIELRKWADIGVIAPLDANTLAKISHGLCDNLVTSILRAWQFKEGKKPLVLCPSMNTSMWEHVLTQEQLEKIKTFGKNITIVEPISKMLMCGDVGSGALAPLDVIAAAVNEAVKKKDS